MRGAGAEGSDVDLAVLGGGLAGGLVALAVAERHPHLRLAVVEQDRIGGNHVWSHFAADVDDADAWLVEPLISHRWDAYDVAFPGFARELRAPYRSITSERLAEVVHARLPAGSVVRGRVADARPDRVRLHDGRTLHARAVLDARGPGDLGLLRLGYQKFVGQVLHTRAPHGVQRPVVMDATVEQRDGYRFVYLLPFGPQEVFVEDTYYSDSADLDVRDLQRRIAAYGTARGWQVERAGRTESGVLPVVVSGDFDAYWASTGTELAKAGMRAGLFHPTTGYSLPDAIRLAGLVAAAEDLSHAALLELTHTHAARTWRERGFYRLLDTMLFGAAEPTERYRVLQRFYRLDPALVQRFYAAGSTRSDQLRILSGRPPVPVHRAVRAIAAAHGRR
ncbi:lycopene beta-cyclase [Friedmanniella luteola]|uniref:Lycopene beta-cyclase n=1 Tax=Friedmanniella luteola TaxID=546871 RepID=A0A1H1L388_9ACTN|nr:lycopene beta-cyclase CrtY [Friedmanniella luteola]SDR68996.1 lycopene beta-cyclase [Friedmanniella luteola]